MKLPGLLTVFFFKILIDIIEIFIEYFPNFMILTDNILKNFDCSNYNSRLTPL